MLLFWFFFWIITIHYVVFPLTLAVASALAGESPEHTPDQPSASLIICALNEEKVIAEKLRNSLEIAYPALEILVVSDGSTDRTAEIAETFAPRVKSLHQPLRQGKAAALTRAVAHATGEILVFSDANTYFAQDSVAKLVRNFASFDIGGVTGRKTIFSSSEGRQSASGDRTYWNVESQIKRWESSLGSISTGDGEIFSVRRELFVPLSRDTINDDTAITLDLIAQEKRVLYEPQAIASEEASITLEDDFNVKARMVLGGFRILQRYAKVLFRPSYFAIQFFAHKVLRHTMPLWLIGIFLTSLYASVPLFLLQVLFYGAAAFGEFRRRKGKALGPLYLPLYYCWMNLAALKGIYFYLKSANGVAIWKRAER